MAEPRRLPFQGDGLAASEEVGVGDLSVDDPVVTRRVPRTRFQKERRPSTPQGRSLYGPLGRADARRRGARAGRGPRGRARRKAKPGKNTDHSARSVKWHLAL